MNEVTPVEEKEKKKEIIEFTTIYCYNVTKKKKII